MLRTIQVGKKINFEKIPNKNIQLSYENLFEKSQSEGLT